MIIDTGKSAATLGKDVMVSQAVITLEGGDRLREIIGSGIDVAWDTGTDLLPDGNFKSTCQAIGIGIDWYFETDGQVQRFGPDEPLTQAVMNDSMLDQWRETWAAEGYPLPWGKTQPVGGLKAFIGENSELLRAVGSFGMLEESNAVGGVLGSFYVSVEDAGNGMVRFEVYNKTGWASGTRVPGYGWSFIPDTDRAEWGPGGSMEQYFYWWEPMHSNVGSSDSD